MRQDVLFTVLLLLASVNLAAAPVPVKLSNVSLGPLEYHVSSYGVLSPNIEELSFQIPGRIEKFLADEGDLVVKGQLLAQLETKDAQESLRAAKVELDQVGRRLERMNTLQKDGSIGKSQLEDVQDEFEQVRIAYAQAKLNLERCRMVAPDDGVILQEIIDSRTSVNPGDAIFSFQSDNAAWKVKVGLIDLHAFTFRKGSRAKVSFAPYPGDVFKGSLTKLAGLADDDNGLFTAEVALSTEGKQLRPGMLAVVDLYEVTDQLFYHLPLDALTRVRNREATIFVLAPGESAVKKSVVTVESIQGGTAYVRENLSDYDRVVVRGQVNLEDATVILPVD